MLLLQCFHEVSGLKINLAKSKVFGLGVEEEEVQRWSQRLGCGWGTLPFIYLGLPVGASMSRSLNWKPVIEKMKNKLAAWKGRLISFGGRWTLARSVLGSVSLYYFSLFIILFLFVSLSFFWGEGGSGRES